MLDYHSMDYDFPPYRPPSESYSALIRASRGCPWNKCLFCTMYKDEKFTAKPLDEVKADIDKAAEIYKGSKTVFIADSDSLVMKDIAKIVAHVKKSFPEMERMTTYARAKTLMKLGPEKLRKVREAGLTRVHVGLESGDPETLELMCKGATPEEMIAGGRAAKEAGLELSYYILIGAGGTDRLKEHALGSARVCNEANPDFIRLRTLVVLRNSLLQKLRDSGEYKPTSPIEKLKEVQMFLEALELTDCEFASDHFTNNIWLDTTVVYKGVYGQLPEAKEAMLSNLKNTIGFLEVTEGDVLDATILYDRGMINSL